MEKYIETIEKIKALQRVQSVTALLLEDNDYEFSIELSIFINREERSLNILKNFLKRELGIANEPRNRIESE